MGEVADGAPYDLTRLQRLFLFTRSDTLYAGSNQVQRNILSERQLGLPRESSVDTGKPFREVPKNVAD